MAWSEFLQRLLDEGQAGARVVYRLSDGAILRGELTNADRLNDDDVIGQTDAQTPYKLYEVVEMEITPESPQENLEQQLEALEQAARVSGLIYRRKPDRIIVRSPYTC